MSYQLAIIDDQEDDLNKIFLLVNDFISSRSIDMQIYKYTHINEFSMDTYFDILLLDIDMPEKSGFDLAIEYRKHHQNVLIIFITNHNDLVYKACNIHPFDFIRKENIELEICFVLEEALYKLNDLYPTVTFYSHGNAYIIRKEAIIFCESFNHSTEIHFDHSTLKVNQQLKDVIIKIDTDHFMRIGRSYYVNMKQVIKLEKLTLYLNDHYQIPISRRNKTKIMNFIMEVQDNAHRN